MAQVISGDSKFSWLARIFPEKWSFGTEVTDYFVIFHLVGIHALYHSFFHWVFERWVLLNSVEIWINFIFQWSHSQIWIMGTEYCNAYVMHTGDTATHSIVIPEKSTLQQKVLSQNYSCMQAWLCFSSFYPYIHSIFLYCFIGLASWLCWSIWSRNFMSTGSEIKISCWLSCLHTCFGLIFQYLYNVMNWGHNFHNISSYT